MNSKPFVRILALPALGLMAWHFCSSTATEAAPNAATPNAFFQRGTPTFVLGTAGNDHADRGIAAQVELIRGMLFPKSPVVTDDSIDVAKGASAWPRNPVVYGGPHVNSLLARLAPSLPFVLERGKLTLGDQVFEGDEYRLIALIPARQPDAQGPGYPEFLLYAGTGSPSVAEINAVYHGGEAILVADTFGRLLTGQWERGSDSRFKPQFTQPRARRIPWRTVTRELQPVAGASGTVHLRFPEQLLPANDEEQVVAACLRGLTQAVRKLELTNPTSLFVYIYPDRGSKRALTGNAGDGHVDLISRAVHVVRFDAAEGGGLERLLAHEGTHVLAYEAWGAAGTPLFGEGLGVWASGHYGGVTLAAWKSRLPAKIPSAASLLGAGFRQMPEQESYPVAGLFVEAVVGKVGLAPVREHLFGATPATWEAACRQAGTTPQELESAWRKAIERP